MPSGGAGLITWRNGNTETPGRKNFRWLSAYFGRKMQLILSGEKLFYGQQIFVGRKCGKEAPQSIKSAPPTGITSLEFLKVLSKFITRWLVDIHIFYSISAILSVFLFSDFLWKVSRIFNFCPCSCTNC